MATVYQRLQVPYSPEQMFDLVVDIERYPAFVPTWRAARIESRRGDRAQGLLQVDQVVADKGIRFRFMTEARFTRPWSLRIASTGRPFRYFVLRWKFRALPGGGSEVTAHARYQLRNIPLRPLAERSFQRTFNHVIDAFAQQARRLYGVPSGAAGPDGARAAPQRP